MDSGVVLLKAAEASITTCTVTIKAIKINKRQMTQGIFRQLPSESLFNETTLDVPATATIWGWVNYKPAGEQERDTQFVVQKGERLVRCPVWVRRLNKNRWSWPQRLIDSADKAKWDAGLYLLTTALEGTLVYREGEGTYANEQFYWIDLGFPFDQQNFVFGQASSMFKYAHGDAVKKAIKPAPATRWLPGQSKTVAVSADEVRETSRQLLRDMIAKFTEGAAGCSQQDPAIVTSAFWRHRLDERAREATDYVKRWNGLMDKLDAVDQLYIAT